jgi:polar amino acid transport system substrate-binding protein
VQQVLGKNSAKIKRFDSTPLALKELESGGVDAVVADEPVVKNYIANNPNSKLRTVTDPTSPRKTTASPCARMIRNCWPRSRAWPK